MQRALEDLPLSNSLFKMVFGLPAYKAGWEMNAFTNNVELISLQLNKLEMGFCGADNPKALYLKLSEYWKAKKETQRLFIAPTGSNQNHMQ